MVKRTGSTDMHLRNLIRDLKILGTKENVKLWKRIAEDLSKPTRQRREVNVLRINQHAKAGETVIVPGKVLAEGTLDKKVTVAAWKFSDAAKAKISKAMTIRQLMKDNPKGKKVRILG